ncbi:hypothetical protein J6590_038924 [Homalodisca vitripennis]|nr:hypothetical protein J6590_038924 [Homalodisca vitripennis]
MVLTPTYQATIDGFQEHMGLGREKALELIKIGVKIARDAVELEKAKGKSSFTESSIFSGPTMKEVGVNRAKT